MESTLAVDASVVVKWLLPELGHESAMEILAAYQEGLIDLVAPYLVVSEVGNVIGKRQRRGELSEAQAQYCFEYFLRNLPILLDSEPASLSALRLGMAHRHPYYDCLYLALALENRCDLITADRKFFIAMRPAFSCVRLLDETKPAVMGVGIISPHGQTESK